MESLSERKLKNAILSVWDHNLMFNNSDINFVLIKNK